MYLPDHQAQLGAGIPVPGRTRGSRDCNPRTNSVGIDELTEGEIVPKMPEMRRRMEKPGPQTCSMLDAKKGVDSYKRPKGRRPLRLLLCWTTSSLRQALGRGRMIHVALDYGRWNQLMARTGDPAYELGHSVAIIGRRERRETVWTLLYDPLDDARRPPGIPQGPRWVPLWKVILAAESFAGGQGKVQAGIFTGGQER